MKIALANVPFSAEQIQTLKSLAAAHAAELFFFDPDTEMTRESISEFDALLGYFPPELVKDQPRLIWAQTPSAGVDHLLTAVNPEKTIVTNSSGAFGIPIAEYLTAGVLALYRKFPAYLKNQREHLWKSEGVTRSVFGSLVTVVGMGDLGSKFAVRMRAFGARVRGVKRSASPAPEYLEALFPVARLAEAVDGADIVALCLPSTRETEGLISEDIIARMKNGAILLNAGRGATLDEAALIGALEDGRLSGAVLDVTSVEPLPPDSPLWDMENVILTPHVSGSNADPVCSNVIYDIFRDNLERFLTGQPLVNVVDYKSGY